MICGGGRAVGKTTLARRLEQLLPGAVAVKLGEHPAKPDKNVRIYPRETPSSFLMETYSGADYLIIESGTILFEVGFEPDLVVFLPAPGGDKPGSSARRDRADIICGQTSTGVAHRLLTERLGLDGTLADRATATLIP